MDEKIPRSSENDYSTDITKARQKFIESKTGVNLKHVKKYSFDPGILPGNIEHFTGVAQVPIGIAGPVLVNGEHANGDFYVPLATTEGTLVASYNRGMKITRMSGGIDVTISDDAMQRAPVFIFKNAREARDFGLWLDKSFLEIKAQAETTTSIGKLVIIERYHAGRYMYLRFDYTTGDAAGQNMTGKATFMACEWIRSHYEPAKVYILDSNFATDKKASMINTLKTRGKRVTAEVTIPEAIVRSEMNSSPFKLEYGLKVSMIGSYMSGAMNNGLHSANALAALFIATGQDAANVAESHTAVVNAERTREGDFYYSITIPSLIVATYGGGTGLATQRECLEILGCFGVGKVMKFAEIAAATALAGEISLMSAINIDKLSRAIDWVSSHDKMGRNR
ncbi:MAG: hydroxymethylglutaryl-CoA reductase [Deltaproteobacteria bacterium]|nr:hydroxymethylglutaryl-CoA reductase [Deltaproteobacteria bacterium]